MDGIDKVKELALKAENFKAEGNYYYAHQCYVKIISVLKVAYIKSNQQTGEILKEKMTKYQLLDKQMLNKEKQKPSTKMSNLGIVPIAPSKPLFGFVPKSKEAIKPKQQCDKIDSDVEQLIVKNIKLTFKDIMGMEQVKALLDEAVIRPKKRPDLYQGIRAPPKGILMYGPPGNGKTYICKALANESGCTFFSLSASSIMNKFVGESQKMLKKIFMAAEKMSPAIIFIDEIDSMLTARSENENEASRRLKTEFLVLLDGISSPNAGDLLVIGATNLPKELDLAARRRFGRFIYVGLPELVARVDMVHNCLEGLNHNLTKKDIESVAKMLDGYCASEIRDVVKMVCMEPLRELGKTEFEQIDSSKLRSLTVKDFSKLLKQHKPMLSKEELAQYKVNI